MSVVSTLLLVGGTVLPSFLIAWSACYVIRRAAPAWGLIDHPGHRKVHTRPTPLGGGLAVWLGVLLTFALGQIALWILLGHQQGSDAADLGSPAILPEFIWPHLGGLAAKSGELWGLLLAASGIMVLGLVDDFRQVDWRIRLAVQVLVATAGVWYYDQWRLTAFIDLPVFTGFLSVIWIVMLVNTFNMLDNMDGLSGGMAVIASTFLAAVLLISPEPGGSTPQLFVGGFLLVLAGAMVGFLWHNRPPAHLFMGDAGGYFIGFCLAVATLLATFAESSPGNSGYTLLAPFCVLAVPLYDTVTVLWIRVREGRSPLTGDMSHLSHRLVELGFSKGQAVATIYLMTATCSLAGLLLTQVTLVGACLIVLLVVCILVIIAILETIARRKINT